MNFPNILIIKFFIYLLFPLQVIGVLTDVTSTALGSHNHGMIAAFGDFNADKNTDIFVIADEGKTVKLLLASITSEFTETTLLKKGNGTITSVVPADFNGDSRMDILVTRKLSDTKSNLQLEIHWGSLKTDGLESSPLIIAEEFIDQPLLLDANGDMTPDLMGQTAKDPKTVKFWIFKHRTKGNYTVKPLTTESIELKTPQSSGFVDMTNDLTADLCLVAKDGVIIWLNEHGQFVKQPTVPFPTAKLIGQAAYIDVDGDSKMDIVLPTCADPECIKSEIHVLYNSETKWTKLPVNFKSGDKQWHFVKPDSADKIVIPITLRVGDYNFDGFPDLLAVLAESSGDQRAVLLTNEECGICGSHHRMFSVDWGTQLNTASNKAVLPAFFDYLENGILDVVITTYNKDNGYKIHMLNHKFVEDACFIKVMVTSGLCSKDCLGGRKPYGVNQPGPAVNFETLDSDGQNQVGLASQLTQSAYFSLHLPFIIFGLGQTPNFLDSLRVGIPHPNGTNPRTRTWTSVIPNSQLIIIPYPNDDPSSWSNKLFVTPSRLVLLTGAALLGTCGFLAGIVGILQWREKVEDKREKLQEAHKFHFDAM